MRNIFPKHDPTYFILIPFIKKNFWKNFGNCLSFKKKVMYTEKQQSVWRNVHGKFGFEIWDKVQQMELSEEVKPIDQLKGLCSEFMKNNVSNDQDFLNEYKSDEETYNVIILNEFIENFNSHFNKEVPFRRF